MGIFVTLRAARRSIFELCGEHMFMCVDLWYEANGYAILRNFGAALSCPRVHAFHGVHIFHRRTYVMFASFKVSAETQHS
jgi:hypothetical protein